MRDVYTRVASGFFGVTTTETPSKTISVYAKQPRTPRKIRIALCGKAGAGKNTFFDLAVKNFPHLMFEEIKFAGKLYDLMYLIQENLGFEHHKDGKILQFLGQHYRDKCGGLFWVNKLFKGRFIPSNAILTDCRYLEELDECENNGFVTVKIDRRIELRAGAVGNRDNSHPSETSLDSVPNTRYDFIINNNGTLDSFEAAVISIIKEIERCA